MECAWPRLRTPTRPRPRLLRQEGNLAVFSSPEACLEACRAGQLHLDAVSICVPTSAHYSVATQALAQGLDVLLEKPIAATLAEADALVGQAAASRRILQVGLLERFNPAVTAVEPLVNGPMFFEAHRLSVFHRRALDVDVVLDLMIHDLDIVLSFVRSPVSQLHAVGLRILSPKVDIANVRLEFASGCVANFTASRVSTETVRKLRFFQPHQYLSIDYARQDLLIINVATDASPAKPGASQSQGPMAALFPASRRSRAGSPAAGDPVLSGFGSDPHAAAGDPKAGARCRWPWRSRLTSAIQPTSARAGLL